MKSDTPESNQWLKGYDDTSTVLDAHKTMQKLERQRDEWKAVAEQADIRTGRAKRERDRLQRLCERARSICLGDADSSEIEDWVTDYEAGDLGDDQSDDSVTNLRAMNLKLQLQLTKISSES